MKNLFITALLCWLAFVLLAGCQNSPSGSGSNSSSSSGPSPVVSPYLVKGDKIYSYSSNYNCFVSQELTFTSGSSGYSGLTINIDRYAEGHGNSVDISGFDRIHFQLSNSVTGVWICAISDNAEGTIGINYGFFVAGNNYSNIDLNLNNFNSNTNIFTSANVSNIVITYGNTGANSFVIKDIYFYNSITSAKFRIAGIQCYPWQTGSGSIAVSKNVFEDELDYDTSINAGGLAVILNKTAEDYSSVVNITSCTNVIFDIKCDVPNVDVVFDDGTTTNKYTVTGVNASSYSNCTVSLSQFSGVDFTKIKCIRFEAISAVSGKLFVKNIKFD